MYIGYLDDAQGFREEWIPIPEGMTEQDFGRRFFRPFWHWPATSPRKEAKNM